MARLLVPISALLLGSWLILTQGVLTALALMKRRAWQVVAGAGLALLGCLFVVGGLGEPLDPVASDVNAGVSALLCITGLVGALALVAAGVAAVVAALRS